jgi:hypothetical protein
MGQCTKSRRDSGGSAWPRALGLGRDHDHHRGRSLALAAPPGAPPTAISCLGAFRTPAASARGEHVLPASKNLHRFGHSRLSETPQPEPRTFHWARKNNSSASPSEPRWNSTRKLLNLVDDEGSALVGDGVFVGWLAPNCQRELSIVVLPDNNSRDFLAERAVRC